MNVIGGLLHLAVLAWSWPLIRYWWGRGSGEQWAVVASLLLPVVSWFWLVPCTIGVRWRLEAQAHERRHQERLAQRSRDIAFWREQVATGDVPSAWAGIELLAMWGVPVVAPKPATGREVTPRRLARVRALPGAHPYADSCQCRNCGRARAWVERVECPTSRGGERGYMGYMEWGYRRGS